MMLIGEKIRKIRELKGYSQEYLSMELGISQKTYSQLESNQSPIDFTRLDKIATIFEIEIMQLLSFNENNLFQNNTFPLEDKEIYQKHILHLEAENKYLKERIKKLSNK